MPTRDMLVPGMQSVHLIPDVLPDPFEPTIWVDVIYPGHKQAELGGFMTVEDTQEEPEIILSPFHDSSSSVDTSKTYTFVMTDPDAPSRAEPIYRQFRHWVITGVKFPDSGESAPAVKTKPSTTPYRPPGPRPGSGLHRYTFLLFEEPSPDFTVPEGSPEYGPALEQRRSWNAVDFANAYELRLVGASFFLVQAAD